MVLKSIKKFKTFDTYPHIIFKNLKIFKIIQDRKNTLYNAFFSTKKLSYQEDLNQRSHDL